MRTSSRSKRSAISPAQKSTSSSSEQGYQQGGEASGLIKAIQIGGSEQSEGHYATACGRASTSGKAKAEHSKNVDLKSRVLPPGRDRLAN